MTSQPPKLSIIFENKHWLAVNKVSQLSVEKSPYRDYTMESLVYDYLSQFYKNPYVGIVHRLDRVTSGVLLFAKRKSILRKINEQFRRKKIKKRYLAIVEKAPLKKEGTLTNFLGKDRSLKKGFVTKNKVAGSVEGVLKYKIIGQNKYGYLLKVEPLSGKYHQIRIQLSHIGCPIIGDEKYGAQIIDTPNTIALHAWQLSLTNPSNEEVINLTAQLPEKYWWKGFEEKIQEK